MVQGVRFYRTVLGSRLARELSCPPSTGLRQSRRYTKEQIARNCFWPRNATAALTDKVEDQSVVAARLSSDAAVIVRDAGAARDVRVAAVV